MATCGYVCPSCEGKQLDEEGNPCGWCVAETTTSVMKVENESQADLADWIKNVHEGSCCWAPEE